ncbi:MAG: CdvA-like protein [Thermoproteota archaeon]
MAREPLTVESIQSLIGETVYDPYGRILGKLVSFESDVDGTVSSIVVETEARDVKFYPAPHVEVKDGRVVVQPEWRILSDQVIASYQRALRRLKGLEDMYSRNEVPASVYHEFRKKLDASLAKLRSEASKLKTMLSQRMREIEDANLRLDRAIASLKVSYLAGEVGEKQYKLAIENLRSAKDSYSKELDDLKRVKSRLESLEAGSLEVLKREEKEQESTEAPEQQMPIHGIQPIPVKVLEG